MQRPRPFANVADALIIRDSIFARCRTELSSGGAVTATGATMIADTDFISCEADRDGAAIYLSAGAYGEYVSTPSGVQETPPRATIEGCSIVGCGAARNIVQIWGYHELNFVNNDMTLPWSRRSTAKARPPRPRTR